MHTIMQKVTRGVRRRVVHSTRGGPPQARASEESRLASETKEKVCANLPSQQNNDDLIAPSRSVDSHTG